MYKSLYNLRNFKKALRLVEDIARQNTERGVDFACGYAVATIETLKSRGRITRNQKEALIDLAYEAAEEAAGEIREDTEEEAENNIINLNKEEI